MCVCLLTTLSSCTPDLKEPVFLVHFFLFVYLLPNFPIFSVFVCFYLSDHLSDHLSTLRYKGISHYEGEEANNHTALPCASELLVEEHHSNYGEPWAGGRDVYEFLAESAHLAPESRVLEIGCGTLRVGLHFIHYLNPEHFHCLEGDELSLMAAFRYELPSQGLLHKRPLIVRGEDMEFSKFGPGIMYDLIYASAVFLHIPDKLVCVGLERLANKLKPIKVGFLCRIILSSVHDWVERSVRRG